MNRADLNDPPTAVGGINLAFGRVFCRKDLNDPPTAVGGIIWLLGECFVERT
jgi:hypothetical protein